MYLQENRKYIAIDLKSFYASVECVARGLDPLTAKLVVADSSKTDKTICLAVSPSLKALGIPGRARLFEVRQKARGVDFIIATPRMREYMRVSGLVYATYLKHVAPEDIFAYSVDEVFIDATSYLDANSCDAHTLAMRMIRDVLATTGITATAGIGTNMYLAKVAMDIEAKHTDADADGVRIAELDEMAYRRRYWNHRPLTDFWRIGHGLAAKLEANSMYTMGDVARMSLHNENVLYKLFGVNAELLIDHAWGWEPCTMKQIKSYRPSENSLSSGQVLSFPYNFEKARLVTREMADALVLDLVAKNVVTDQIVLTVGYDIDNLSNDSQYHGPVVKDHYGRLVPKPAHGSINLPHPCSSTSEIMEASMILFDKIVDRKLSIRRIYIVAAHLYKEECTALQLDLFKEEADSERERKRQEAILAIRSKFGKNAILKGMNFEDGATAMERNKQVGGHKG